MNTWKWNCQCERVCQFLKAFVTATLTPRKLTSLYFFISSVWNCFFLEGFQLNVLRAFSLKIKGKRKMKRPCKIKTKISLKLFWHYIATVLPSIMYLSYFGNVCSISLPLVFIQSSGIVITFLTCWNGRNTILSGLEPCHFDAGLLLVLGHMPIIGEGDTLEGRQSTGSATWLPGFASVNLFESVCLSLERLLQAYLVVLRGLTILRTKCLAPG